MPLYEYECKQCHRRTEKIQKFSDPALTECPYCGGHMERLIHAPAVSFKGGGWYADLYSSSKSDGAAKESSGSDSGSSGASSADGASAASGSSPSSGAAATPAAAPASSSGEKK